MALFGWKKSGDAAKPSPGGAGNGGGGGKSVATGGSGDYEFSPEKASRWFHHARTSGEAGNHEYAMTCWLSGLRFEPTNIDAINSFFSSAAQNGGGVPKAVVAAVGGKTDVDKFLAALLQFAGKTGDADLAVRTVVAASVAGLSAVVTHLAPIALRVAMGNPKPKKDHFMRIMESCEKAGNFETGVRAGEAALRIDPADTKLSTYIRNMAAQSTMSRGGYDQTGEAGGFRSNVRDAAKQQMLEEQERVVRSENVQDRTIAVAKEEYEARPTDRASIKKYAEELVKRAKPEDINEAIAVLMKGYADTQEFRFRAIAGDLRMRVQRVALRQAQAAAAASPQDAALAATAAELQKKFTELEVSEFEARMAAYPTDLLVKFELGKRYFDAGRYNDAIDLLQQAKDDTKNRAATLSYLGRAFAAIGWHEEAIGTFRLALEGHADANDAAGMELRYGLMCSLQQHAADASDIPAAEEAIKLAQQIAVQQISFKDVRARRDEIKALIAKLKG